MTPYDVGAQGEQVRKSLTEPTCNMLAHCRVQYTELAKKQCAHWENWALLDWDC